MRGITPALNAGRSLSHAAAEPLRSCRVLGTSSLDSFKFVTMGFQACGAEWSLNRSSGELGFYLLEIEEKPTNITRRPADSY